MADSDGDIYHYKVFDESKKTKAQEALDSMEKRIRNNFSKFQVEKKDQFYRIGEIVHVEEAIDVAEGFEVKLKVNKDALRINLRQIFRQIESSVVASRASLFLQHKYGDFHIKLFKPYNLGV